jgi:glutaredoxin
MKTVMAFLVSFFMVLTIAGLAPAEVYKWVDENGVIHFTDSPPQDVGSIRKVESIQSFKSKSQVGLRPERETRKIRSNKYPAQGSAGEAKKSKRPSVELYTTSWCPYCDLARDFFRSRGISFTEYDIEKDTTAARRKKQLDKRKGVPFAVVNGQRIHGFSETAYEKALKGYP